MTRRPLPLRRFAADRSGIAAIEFALVLPVVALVVAATVDFGAILFTKFKLDESVSSAANYAMVNSGAVSSTGALALATSMANLVASSRGSGWANSSVQVNAGQSAAVINGALTTSGAGSQADSCYCPTGSAASVSWGSAQTCGASCPGGGVAGKFVQLTADKSYTPLFSGFGLVTSRTITAASLVQVQ
jgi:Flp pilus assembly protein TadG